MLNTNGFPDENDEVISIPLQFLTEFMPSMKHLGELQLCLYFFGRLSRMEGKFRYLTWDDLYYDNELATMLDAAETDLDESLALAIKDGILLEADLNNAEGSDQPKCIYFLNTPKGRAAIQAISTGKWTPTTNDDDIEITVEDRPNIYQLYEENIGPITPMTAEALKDAEDTYPMEWIEDAIRVAVENNKRNWRYCTAILERWYREGRNARKETKNRGDTEETRQRYVKGKFSDFIEH